MSPCPLEDEVVAWVAGDRSGAERALLEVHVDTCASCRELAATLARTTASGAQRRLGRYVLGDLLGRGGMGEVYAATLADEPGARVAVKILHSVDAPRLLQFKQEFRALADISHPNLALLHELGHDGDSWFIAMELVLGTDFATHVAGDETRLRTALGQLTEGLRAIHAAGKVHSDIKPSNVYVDKDGRVVILDFGLVANMARPEKRLAGTPRYMAPEQLAGSVVPASDWYAVGVMLCEALAGRQGDTELEYLGSNGELARLATRLLESDPVRRAGAREVAETLGHGERLWRTSSFVGRERELARLRACFDEVCRGEGRVVSITGPSGMGKTTLVHGFIESIRTRAWVVEGRCYERESVPLKAIDPIVDDLVPLLGRMSPEERAALQPRDAGELVRMFPVLRRIWDVAEATMDLRASKIRATKALRELFVRIAARGPLVLVIDDLQWSDDDSQPILVELLRTPMPPLMFIACSRASTSPPLVPGVLMNLEPLDAASARAIAKAVTSDRDDASLEAVVRESGGNPFFLTELARSTARGHVSLSDVIVSRLIDLPASARQVLTALAISGNPVPLEILTSALGIEGATLGATRLRAERWAESRNGLTLETSHDRVAAAVLGTLSVDERRDWHRRFAIALEDRDPSSIDPEKILEHWLGAGDSAHASQYATTAAEFAMKRLAFEHAVRLWNLKSSLDAKEATQPFLWSRLAEALAAAGRGGEAAQAYDEARQRARGEEAFDFGRLAAEQLLRSGRIDAGLEALRSTMKTLRVSLPRSPRAALLSLSLRRLFVRARLLLPLRIYTGDPRALRLIDACWAVASALGTVDTIRGADLHARTLALALESGDSSRVARSLAVEAAFIATRGARAAPRAERLLARAEALADPSDAQVCATIAGSRGLSAYLGGRWREAHLECAKGADLFARTTGSLWERQTACLYSLLALTYLGQFTRLREELRRELADADGRDDLYMSTSLRTAPTNLSWLADDDAKGAQEAVEMGEKSWSRRGFHLQHHWSMLARCNIDLYEGDSLRAAARIDDLWPRLRVSRLMRIVVVHVEASHLRARTWLASAAGVGKGERMESALLEARRIASLDVPHAPPLSDLVVASIDAAHGHIEQAASRFRRAAAALRDLEMDLHAAAAEWRNAELRGENTRAMDAKMRSLGIAAPEKMVNLLVPWCGLAVRSVNQGRR